MSDSPDLIDLLIRAYDMLEDLTWDEDYEPTDDDLRAWLDEAGQSLRTHTNRSARALVDEMLRSRRSTT